MIFLSKIYLDTNILINQFLSARRLLNAKKRNETIRLPQRLIDDKKMLDLVLNGDIVLIISEWTVMEYRSLRDIILKEKLIRYGYSANEYTEGRREVELEKEELEDIETTIKALREGSISENHDLDLILLSRLSEAGVDIIDGILFMQAMKSDCDFFVTRDELFIKRINQIALSDDMSAFMNKSITPKEYLKMWHVARKG